MISSQKPPLKSGIFSVGTWLVLIISLAGYVLIGYFLSRQQFFLFISVYLFLFAAYIYLLRRINAYSFQEISFLREFRLLLASAVIFRLAFLFSIPALSDDYFRFIWDGMVWTSGENPYGVRPVDYIQDCSKHTNHLVDLFTGLNSKEYYTIYPPVCQFIFAASAKLFPENMIGALVVLRASCLASELGTIYIIQKLLKHFNLPKQHVLLYALNPLVIIELTGNLHLEALMIFFLVLSLYLLITATRANGSNPGEVPSIVHSKNNNKRLVLSALSYSFAIGVKLIPLIFLPFLIRKLNWKNSIPYFLIIGVSLLVLFLPFISKELISEFTGSINLYFQKFEFNASIYYLIRWIGFRVKGYNIIQETGPWLALATLVIILIVAVTERKSSWSKFFLSMQWALTIYLLLATTVHPWYITTLIMFAVFTGYQYPVVWSLFIALSYATYQSFPYYENLWFTAVEYVLVTSVMLWEIYRRDNLKI